VKSKELKYFYERLLQGSGVPLKYFRFKKTIRMNKIKSIFNEN